MDNLGIYSDIFKDANGFRPRGVSVDEFLALSNADQWKAIKQLDVEVERQISEDLEDTEIDWWKKYNDGE